MGEISTGERWQFEAELLYPLGTGRPVGKIIDVEHHLKFRDELCLISSGTFFVHAGDRTTIYHRRVDQFERLTLVREGVQVLHRLRPVAVVEGDTDSVPSPA